MAAMNLHNDGRSADGSSADGPRSPRMIFVALPPSFALDLATQARRLGYGSHVAPNLAGLLSALGESPPPDAAVVNFDVADSEEMLATVATHLSNPEIAAITSVPSIIRVAKAIRCGAKTVLARPATFGQILAALELEGLRNGKLNHMSLDRVIWEYLNQVILEAGSISEAARRLRLDRTSLRRMLRKVPPLG
jgi:ActR/RegA family two-component response regulator